MSVMRFAHFLGVSLWLGGAVSLVVLERAAAGAGGSASLTQRLFARVQSFVIAPGAILTVLTGVMLTMAITSRGASQLLTRPGMVVMQAAGVLAAVLVVFVGVPTANQLAVLVDADGSGGNVARLRRRQTTVSGAAGVLALTALFFGVVVR